MYNKHKKLLSFLPSLSFSFIEFLHRNVFKRLHDWPPSETDRNVSTAALYGYCKQLHQHKPTIYTYGCSGVTFVDCNVKCVIAAVTDHLESNVLVQGHMTYQHHSFYCLSPVFLSSGLLQSQHIWGLHGNKLQFTDIQRYCEGCHQCRWWLKSFWTAQSCGYNTFFSLDLLQPNQKCVLRYRTFSSFELVGASIVGMYFGCSCNEMFTKVVSLNLNLGHTTTYSCCSVLFFILLFWQEAVKTFNSWQIKPERRDCWCVIIMHSLSAWTGFVHATRVEPEVKVQHFSLSAAPNLATMTKNLNPAPQHGKIDEGLGIPIMTGPWRGTDGERTVVKPTSSLHSPVHTHIHTQL